MLRGSDELKHSVRIYLLLFGGPTKDLAARLLKVIDILEDSNASEIVDDSNGMRSALIKRRETESYLLSLAIISDIADRLIIDVQNHIKWCKQTAFNMIRSKTAEPIVDEHITKLELACNNLINVFYNTRRNPQIQCSIAKNSLLNNIASTLDVLSASSGEVYPTIFNMAGTKLNNLNISDVSVIAPFRDRG